VVGHTYIPIPQHHLNVEQRQTQWVESGPLPTLPQITAPTHTHTHTHLPTYPDHHVDRLSPLLLLFFLFFRVLSLANHLASFLLLSLHHHHLLSSPSPLSPFLFFFFFFFPCLLPSLTHFSFPVTFFFFQVCLFFDHFFFYPTWASP